MKNCIIYILLFLVVISCTNNIETKNDSQFITQTTISLNLDEANPIHLSEFFSDIDYYYLKTPADRPIGRIWKILINGEHVAFFDRLRKSIFIYKKNGEYVNEIEILQGKGPGELEHPMDFTFKDENTISVLGAFKIVNYNLSGSYTEEIYYDFIVRDFTYNSRIEKYIGNAGNSPNATQLDEENLINHNLFYFGRNGNITDAFLPISKGKENMGFSIPNNFPKYNTDTYYIPHLVDTIYQINDNSVSAKYVIDFGENSIPQKVFSKRENYEHWAQFAEEELMDKQYASFISVFAESDSVIYLRFIAKEQPFEAFYNKANGSTRVGQAPMINDIDYGLTSYNYEGHGNSLYTVIDANTLLKHLNDLYKNDPEKYSDPKLAPLRKIAHEMDDNRNPILMIANYK